MTKSNEKSNRSLGIKTIFARSDMMGMIPSHDQDMIDAVQENVILNDDDVARLKTAFPNRAIEAVLRCHIINLKEDYTVENIPTDFLEWFSGFSTSALTSARNQLMQVNESE